MFTPVILLSIGLLGSTQWGLISYLALVFCVGTYFWRIRLMCISLWLYKSFLSICKALHHVSIDKHFWVWKSSMSNELFSRVNIYLHKVAGGVDVVDVVKCELHQRLKVEVAETKIYLFSVIWKCIWLKHLSVFIFYFSFNFRGIFKFSYECINTKNPYAVLWNNISYVLLLF